ncbi:hypothetical protein A0J61_10920, partial [Choanephora cucurbitarum]
MLTNNYIESWHNQLKTVFLWREENRRLDKLVFVLVEEVEYFLRQEDDRILSNNGAMNKYQKMQKVREMEAEKLTADEVSAMISRSLGHSEDKCGEWQVLSFSEEEVVYDVAVSVDLLVVSCSCLDFEHRRRPCKHMYLLARFLCLKVCLPPVSLPAAKESAPANVTDDVQQETRSAVKTKAERCIQVEKTFHHFNTDLTRMPIYGTDAD